MSNYSVQDGQSIYDVVSQLYGTMDNIVDLLSDNRATIDSVDSSLSSGQKVDFTVTNEVVSSQFRTDGTIVNTSDPLTISGHAFNLDFNLDFDS